MNYKNIVLSAIYGVISLIVAFSLAWVVLAKMNFLYGVWHDAGGIGEGIEKYGPQNRYKVGFELTSKEQREQLFGEINTAVHAGGEGLAEIEYQLPSGETHTLLRQAEVVHLQDVANLIDVLRIFVLAVIAVWLAWHVFVFVKGRLLPSIKSQLMGVMSILLMGFISVLVIGPVMVFNQLHIWVFPENHQWFFYYQESLMSTMMVAPRLFGYIAAALVVLSVPCYIVLQVLVEKLRVKIEIRQIPRR